MIKPYYCAALVVSWMSTNCLVFLLYLYWIRGPLLVCVGAGSHALTSGSLGSWLKRDRGCGSWQLPHKWISPRSLGELTYARRAGAGLGPYQAGRSPPASGELAAWTKLHEGLSAAYVPEQDRLTHRADACWAKFRSGIIVLL